MLLAVDIGNTNTAIGIFLEKKLIEDWKIRTERERTSDEYSLTLLSLLNSSGIETSEIQSAIISSVVPPLTPVFQNLCQKLFKLKPLVVGPGLKTGMSILYENPLEVGADRVVVAVAAFEKYGDRILASALHVLLLEHQELRNRLAKSKAEIAELAVGGLSREVWQGKVWGLRAYVSHTRNLIEAHAKSEQELLLTLRKQLEEWKKVKN